VNKLEGRKLEGRTCVVTGGAGSLGTAVARLFLAAGARVLLVDIDARGPRAGGERDRLRRACHRGRRRCRCGRDRGLYRQGVARFGAIDVHPSGAIDNSFQLAVEKGLGSAMGVDGTAFFNAMIPLGRHGLPDEIAKSVLFLASEDSSFTTGATLMADGGMSV